VRSQAGPRKWPCRVCGGQRTPEGYDPCVGWLPGAQHVCCGHQGNGVHRYVITLDGRRFDGLQAFQQWARWQASPEGRTVTAHAHHGVLFGWAHWNAGRGPCSTCQIPCYECACPQPSFGMPARQKVAHASAASVDGLGPTATAPAHLPPRTP